MKYLILLFFTFCSSVLGYAEFDKMALAQGQPYLVSKEFYSPQQALDQLNTDAVHYFETEADNLGLIYSGIWTKIKISNPTDSCGVFYLELAAPRFDSVHIFDIHQNLKKIYAAGDSYPFAAKGIKHRNAVCDLYFDKGETKELLMYVFKEGDTSFPLYLWSPLAHANFTSKENIKFGFIFGLLIMVFAISAITFVTYRTKRLLFYSCYIFLLFLAIMGNYGFSHQYLFPNSSFMNNEMYALIAHFTIVAMFVFAREFLGLSKGFRKRSNFIVHYVCILPLIFLGLVYLSFFWSEKLTVHNHILMKTSLLLFMVGFVTLIVDAVSQFLKHKKKEAGVFLLAFSLVLVSFGLHALVVAQFLPINFFTTHVLLFGTLSEVLLLTFALGYDMVQKQKQNIALLKELNTKQKEITQAVIRGENSERQRISAEIHDEIGSGLTHLKLVIQYDDTDSPYLQLVDQLSESTRKVLLKIAPLQHATLDKNIKDLVEKTNSVAACKLHFSSAGTFEHLDEITAFNLMRITQEALNNALKYAKAENIFMTLQYAPADNELILIIEDDGVGFSKEAPTGFGIQTMQERAKQMNAELSFDTKIEEGTSVVLSLSIEMR